MISNDRSNVKMFFIRLEDCYRLGDRMTNYDGSDAFEFERLLIALDYANEKLDAFLESIDDSILSDSTLTHSVLTELVDAYPNSEHYLQFLNNSNYI